MSNNTSYYPTAATVQKMKLKFQPGMRVRLDYMEDPQAPPIGTIGTVIKVDDIGSVCVNWDNGSTLRVAYGTDVCTIVSNKVDLEVDKLIQEQRKGLEQKADEIVATIPDGFAYYEINENVLTWLFFNQEADDGKGCFEVCSIAPWQIPFTNDKEEFWSKVDSVCYNCGVYYSDIESFLAEAVGYLAMQERFENGDKNILSDGCENAMTRIQLWAIEKTIDSLKYRDRFLTYDNMLSKKVHYVRKVEGTVTSDSFTYKIIATDDLEDKKVDTQIDRIMSLFNCAAIFSSRADLREFVWSHNCLHINDGTGETKYAFELRTDEYSYIIRINLTATENNVHIFCYPSANIISYANQALNGIQLVDECGDELIVIEDGSVCTLTKYEADCTESQDVEFVYIDRYHAMIDGNPVHLYSLFDKLHQNGWRVLKVDYWNFPI